jgi:nonsense-mediated mRNA decay protein 3
MMEVEAPVVDAAWPELATVACCMCSAAIKPNPTNMCVQCIRTQVDITEGIACNLTMLQCRGCMRWLRPGWVEAALESRELMAICLRKVNGLKKVKLVDAAWIWTEAHSRRLKLKLTVQKEVQNGAILQQAFIVEFVVRNQQCVDCQASFTNNTWKAVVQIRQRVDHKRTFFYLEQLILKHNAHVNALSVQASSNTTYTSSQAYTCCNCVCGGAAQHHTIV